MIELDGLIELRLAQECSHLIRSGIDAGQAETAYGAFDDLLLATSAVSRLLGDHWSVLDTDDLAVIGRTVEKYLSVYDLACEWHDALEHPIQGLYPLGSTIEFGGESYNSWAGAAIGEAQSPLVAMQAAAIHHLLPEARVRFANGRTGYMLLDIWPLDHIDAAHVVENWLTAKNWFQQNDDSPPEHRVGGKVATPCPPSTDPRRQLGYPVTTKPANGSAESVRIDFDAEVERAADYFNIPAETLKAQTDCRRSQAIWAFWAAVDSATPAVIRKRFAKAFPGASYYLPQTKAGTNRVRTYILRFREWVAGLAAGQEV